ncbi:hypothetical protein COCVIDRAFT_41118 [Bipolaris victoriae FI3]|uniref:Uncharacterized protein n=1 Tax=Bipolaris victoriae (strain FI3) TaxID=930091 RepID=W7DYN9_BIPV3|nr:hypothetical protein COCVIDRAFT_41118 [Bipolaris victoriae FI3]
MDQLREYIGMGDCNRITIMENAVMVHWQLLTSDMDPNMIVSRYKLHLCSLGSFPPFFLVSSAASQHANESATGSEGTNDRVASYAPTVPLGGSIESKEQAKEKRIRERFPVLLATEFTRIYSEFWKNPAAAVPFGTDAPDCKGPYLHLVDIKVHKSGPVQSVYEVEQLDDEMLDYHLMDADMDNADMEDEERLSYLVPFLCRSNCGYACCKDDGDDFDDIDKIEKLVDAPPPRILLWKDEENHPTVCPLCLNVLFLKENDSRVIRIPDSQTAIHGTNASNHASADHGDGHSIPSHEDRSSYSRSGCLTSSDEHRDSDSSEDSAPSL